MQTKWREAIEYTLWFKSNSDEIRSVKGCGFCQVFGLLIESGFGVIECSKCPLDFHGCGGGCGDFLVSWYGRRYDGDIDYSNRKHFWAEFALANPELKVDQDLIFEVLE